MSIQDPRSILQSDLPLFVYSDSSTDLVSFLITWRTKANWNHAMLMVNQGKFAAQAWTYAQVPAGQYMKKGSRLDFFSLVTTNRSAIMLYAQQYVYNRLKQPWWTRMYDWVGIFGQAIGFPKIHTPGLEYCSVDVTHCLKYLRQVAAAYLSEEAQQIIDAIPDEINPQDLHDVMINNPKVFKQYGQYEADNGVIC